MIHIRRMKCNERDISTRQIGQRDVKRKLSKHKKAKIASESKITSYRSFSSFSQKKKKSVEI